MPTSVATKNTFRALEESDQEEGESRPDDVVEMDTSGESRPPAPSGEGGGESAGGRQCPQRRESY